VAERLDTRPIDTIYVTAGPEIAVMERGGLLKKVRDAGQRCLILGLGALPGMTQGQFKAILGHEYGHFSNRDTAGGNLAKQVRLSMHHMALTLAYNGLARWYNPAWLFLNGFNLVFSRITLGASRLQETLADRYAAIAFGVQNFISGLTHIIHQDLAFNTQVNHEIEAAFGQGRDLQNIYTLPPLRNEAQLKRLKVEEDEIMGRPTSPYDSHPAPCERIAMVEQIEAAGVVEDDPKPVWDLLPDAEELQLEMTVIVQSNVREQQA
jgi:Zn-dependent protease with chaperone function